MFDPFWPFVGGAAIATLFLLPALLAAQRRLRRYESQYRAPLPVSVPRVAESCPTCRGPLALARMEDDFGPDLHLADITTVYADGTPIFNSVPLSAKAREQNEGVRGMLRGGWCATCELFYPF